MNATRPTTRRHLRAAAGALATSLALLSGGTVAAAAQRATPSLTSAEHTFSAAFQKLVPALNRANNAVTVALNGASNDSNAKLEKVFASVAAQWRTATTPLLALKPPSREAATFTTISHYVAAIEADLLGVVKAGKDNSASEGRTAGEDLDRDFASLDTAVLKLRRDLGLA